jgi:hypothetical protein
MRRSADPTGEVAHAWAARVGAEYRSAAVTSELVLWLLRIGASPDLVRDGLAIVGDEVRHAELSREVWLRAGGEGAQAVDRDTLGIARAHASLELDVAAAIVRFFCLGETVAVPLFAALRKGATVPVARRALDRILRDEVRHRAFGWEALGWMLELPCAPDVRAMIGASLPSWLAELDAIYGDGLEGGLESVTEAERAWGLAPAGEYAAILARTKRRVYAPRFAALGVPCPG